MHLVKCSLPQLQSLQMGIHTLNLQAAAKLSEGSWPKLEQLSLRIPNAAVLQQVAKGSWPRLKDLSISRFASNDSYLQLQHFALTRLDPLQGANWPLLSKLSADT